MRLSNKAIGIIFFASFIGVLLYVFSRLPLTENIPEDKSTPVQLPTYISLIPKTTPQQHNERKQISASIIYHNFSSLENEDTLTQLGDALIHGSEDDKIDAIQILSRVGLPEQVAIIEEYAKDPDQEIAVRNTAIENIDWEKNVEFLDNIIRSGGGVGEATIYMAETKELSDETRAILNEAIHSSFVPALRPSTIIAILDYLLEQDKSRFDDIITQVTYDNFFEDEKEDVTALINKRASTIQE